MKTVIFLDGPAIARIHPVANTIRPGWSKRVEAVYTVGKSDPIWSDASGNEGGTTLTTTARAAVQHLNAIIAVDVQMRALPSAGSIVLSSSGGGTVTFSKPSFVEVRRAVFQTLCHELFHVVQGWAYGGNEQFSIRYAEAWNDAQAIAATRDPSVWTSSEAAANAGYSNRYEKAAFAQADQALRMLKPQVDTGLFDPYLPIPLIRSQAA